MIERGSEAYNRFLKVIDYFNNKFELCRAFYVDGAGFYYIPGLGDDLWGFEKELVEIYGEYDYEYDSSHKLVIITDTMDDNLDFCTDLEEFVKEICNTYHAIKLYKIRAEEGLDAGEVFLNNTSVDDIVKMVKEELQI